MARILWFIKGLGLGGAEHLLATAASLVDRRRFTYEAAFLLPWKNALVGDLEAAGIPTQCIKDGHRYDPWVVSRLVRVLRDGRFDLVHAHLPYSGILARMAARIAGIPCVYTEHNVQERYHPVTRVTNQLTLRWCARTLAVSEEVRASLQLGRWSRGAQVVTVPNGVDLARLSRSAAEPPSIRDEFGIPPDCLIVGAVAVFRPQKRLDIWVRAAAQIAAAHPQVRFFLVGDGTGMSEVRRLAGDLGLHDRLILPGMRRDAARFFSGLDVCMMSSGFEGLPLAVLEAMALGRPVVATRVGGVPAAVRDGHEGFLVDPNDPTALAERVVALLRDPHLRQAMGTAGADRVLRQFSIQRMVQMVEQTYAEVLDLPYLYERTA